MIGRASIHNVTYCRRHGPVLAVLWTASVSMGQSRLPLSDMSLSNSGVCSIARQGPLNLWDDMIVYGDKHITYTHSIQVRLVVKWLVRNSRFP